MAAGDLPVLVGAGQITSHWQAGDPMQDAPSAVSLARQASARALSDAGLQARDIDTLAVIPTFTPFVPGYGHEHGVNSNLPGTLARDLGAAPSSAIYSAFGGQAPQALANELAARIHAGETDMAMIAGAEAIRAAKSATKAGITLDWEDSADLPFDDRGLGEAMLIRPEIKHGLVPAHIIYALIENAMAAAKGEDRTARRTTMSALFARFAEIARSNPYSAFRQAFDAPFLATPSAQNFPLADPYLKWHVAQDNVNQGAAIVMMSQRKADELGVPGSNRLYLTGAGEASDTFLIQRPHLDRSWAMQTAAAAALAQADITADEIDLFDLYSCFPCAVFAAGEALGLDASTDERALTVTGGLPFFGGPGNNYSLHAIASLAMRLRSGPARTGLILANGGAMTKAAIGIWSRNRPPAFAPVETARKPDQINDIALEPAGGTIETHTVARGRDGTDFGVVLARTDGGQRFAARASATALKRLQGDESPIGQTIQVTSENEINTFDFV
ncbi:MAG: acetyl-CoA acetyltransferase [Pseudomonadota bacterium]